MTIWRRLKLDPLTLRALLLVAAMLSLTLCLGSGPAIRQAPPPGWVSDARFERALDGDTALFSFERTLRIRFLDCWCAEVHTSDLVEKKMGLEADAYLKALAKEFPGQWRVEIPTGEMQDGDIADLITLGRFVGRVYLPDGRCVNDMMVAGGHAAPTKAALKAMIERRRKKAAP